MTWRTIIVCDDCYLRRRKTDRKLVETPVRLISVNDDCDDCGATGIHGIPIRADVSRPTPTDNVPRLNPEDFR